MKLRRRTLLKLFAFVLAGAIINVAVAWGCALFADHQELAPVMLGPTTRSGVVRPRLTYFQTSALGYQQIAFVPDQTGMAGIVVRDMSDAGLPYWTTIPEFKPYAAQARQAKICVAAGWPLRSLRAESTEYDARWMLRTSAPRVAAMPLPTLRSVGVRVGTPKWDHAIVLKDQSTGGPFSARVLPFDPIWFPTILNVLIYSVVLWLAAHSWSRHIRKMRLRRGLCPWCRYRIGSSATCTECGASLPVVSSSKPTFDTRMGTAIDGEQRSKRRLLIVMITIVLIAALGAIAFRVSNRAVINQSNDGSKGQVTRKVLRLTGDQKDWRTLSVEKIGEMTSRDEIGEWLKAVHFEIGTIKFEKRPTDPLPELEELEAALRRQLLAVARSERENLREGE